MDSAGHSSCCRLHVAWSAWLSPLLMLPMAFLGVLQVELRLIAHLSEDEVLCRTLSKEGQDPFTAMACMWQKCSIDEVREAKAGGDGVLEIGEGRGQRKEAEEEVRAFWEESGREVGRGTSEQAWRLRW